MTTLDDDERAARLFADAFTEASQPYFEVDQLTDSSRLRELRAFTLAQAVMLLVASVSKRSDVDPLEIVPDYIRLIFNAVIDMVLEARHPTSLLAWATYADLMASGSYRSIDDVPMLHAGWIVGVEDFAEWLAPLGFDLDIHAVCHDGRDRVQAAQDAEPKIKWTNEFIELVRDYKATHTSAETARRFGVSDSFIRRKLRSKKPKDPNEINPWKGMGCRSGTT